MNWTAGSTDSATVLRPAAAYVRMSTEHQQYSTSNQMDVIREFALRRDLEIIKVYSDEGKSGLNIAGRDALATMIADVQSGAVPFRSIIVYDVSRWGRFQDADESAYYEFVCRRAGIEVHYCAEQFENDGSPVSTIVKGVKRAMAGEYSRELSTKVFQGACRLIRLGYKQGGAAGYGLRRMLVDQSGQQKGTLAVGEHKSIQTDRVILVPGPDHEIADVQWMFEAFAFQNIPEQKIAEILNARGVLTDLNRRWTRGTVHQVLTNEKYIGNNVYHKTSFKLKRRHVKNSPSEWIRAEKSWPPLVDPELFQRVQGIILERSRRFSNEEMLTKLRGLLDLNGRLSGVIIDEHDDLPSSAAFRHRFGSLIRAYSLIGYTPATDYSFIAENQAIRRMHPEVVASISAELDRIGAEVEIDQATEIVRVNAEFTISIVLCRHTETAAGSSRWAIRFDAGLRPDITVAVRLKPGNTAILDYYLFPSVDMTWDNLRVADTNPVELDGYQFDDLGCLFRMAERIQISELP